jgi:RNA polymerase sigma-70 factor, ECF subfamily
MLNKFATMAKPSSWVESEERQRQDEFVRAHSRRIFLQIYRVVGSTEDAQDLTQEAFIKALQHAEQLKDLEKAAHWLSRIASNCAIDFLRRKARQQAVGIDSVADRLHAKGEESPERFAIRGQHRGILEEGLQMLTARERTALVLRDMEDRPAEEVAELLGCSKATVRSHIANARVKFRKFLENQGL